MKYNASLQKARSQPGIEQSFLWGQRLHHYAVVKHHPARIHENVSKLMEVYKSLWK